MSIVNISPEIFSVFQLRTDQLIFGTNRGKIYSRTGLLLKNYLPANGRAVARAEIKAIYEDSRGWLWTGQDTRALLS